MINMEPAGWKVLGDALRDSRVAQGLSRRELSSRAGVSEKSIQIAEEGRVPKARWPQSIARIEAALGWKEGEARRIVETGALDGGGAAGRQEDQESPGSELPDVEPEGDDPRLPVEISRALPMVRLFGANCVAYGAPEWLGRAFDNAVSVLLREVAANRHVQQTLFDGEALDGLAVEGGSKYHRLTPQALMRVADKALEEVPDNEGALRDLQRSFKRASERYEAVPTGSNWAHMKTVQEALRQELEGVRPRERSEG